MFGRNRGAKYLAQLTDCVGGIYHVKSHVLLLKQYNLRRVYQALGHKLYLASSDEREDVLGLGDSHTQELLKISDISVYSKGSHSHQDEVLAVKNSLSSACELDIYRTGYPALDRYLQEIGRAHV
jgi:hypothetical protein